MNKKPTILILCTGNSCRSHIAEGYLKSSIGDIANVQSAGAKPSGYVHPVAIEVMKEEGIDISGHHSKHLDEFILEQVDTVITVCQNAEGECPTFPGEVHHFCWCFDDPADATGSDDDVRIEFRRIRDEIKKRFQTYAVQLRSDLRVA